MTLGEVRYKLRQVISNGHPERMRLVTRDSIYVISLAWCGLKGEDKAEFEWELENDYQILRAIQRLSA